MLEHIRDRFLQWLPRLPDSESVSASCSRTCISGCFSLTTTLNSPRWKSSSSLRNCQEFSSVDQLPACIPVVLPDWPPPIPSRIFSFFTPLVLLDPSTFFNPNLLSINHVSDSTSCNMSGIGDVEVSKTSLLPPRDASALHTCC